MRIWFATRPEVAFHLRFRRSSRAADQQTHEKINKYGRRKCDEERTNKRRPVNRPNDAGKYVPMLKVMQTKLAKMHALGRWTLQGPTTEVVFGDVNGRHRPDHDIVQRDCNRRGDLVAAKSPCRANR